MKSLQQFIKAGSINESRFDIDSCDASGNMKFGYMMYDDNTGTVTVIQFNKLSDLAKSYGAEEEMFLGIDKLDVGESVYDGAATIYTRIW